MSELQKKNSRIDKRAHIEITNFKIKYPDVFVEYDSEKSEFTGIYEELNFKIVLPIDYPFHKPIIYINNINANLLISWALQDNSLIIVSREINNIKIKLQEQHIFTPTLEDFLSDRGARSFHSDNLHKLGYLYDCNNFENKKYQFGSGFIYSVIIQFIQHFNLTIDPEMIDNLVDRMLTCSLIKELGCVYLVLKIYEEHTTIKYESYIRNINMYLISDEVKLEFNKKINEFKKNNETITSELSNRLDHLNHILTLYINIWMYNIFSYDLLSFDLNTIIDTFLQTENYSPLYEWSKQFIIKEDKSIEQFNNDLFLDNYNYVTHILRNNSPNLLKFMNEFFDVIRFFDNFENDMFKIDVDKIKLLITNGHRVSKFKTKNPHVSEFPISLVHIESAEINICNAFNTLLEGDLSKLIPNSICQ
jgi:hypothetical protein